MSFTAETTVPESIGEHQEKEKELFEQFKQLLPDLAGEQGALIPALQTAQNLFGYIPEYIMRHISEELSIPFSEVTGVVTFYSYFSTVPRGRYVIRVCMGTACYVRGGKEVLNAIKETLGINVGETTEDRKFSLEIGRCFGACGLAPVVMINDNVHQRVKPAKIREMLAPYENAPEETE